MFFFNRQRDKTYEKIAKPGNQYSVYSNRHYQGEVILKHYLIEEIFEDKVSGFYALGLTSTSRKKHPVLVIRGCGNWGDFKDFPLEFLPYKDLPDVLMGSDKHCQAAQKIGVIKWLNKQASLGKKSDIIGQSLGGKVGQQLAIEAPKYIHHLVTFNSIGISAEEYQRYQGKVKICHYINPLDLFPYVFGDKLLPGTLLQTYNPNILKPDLINQHNKIILDDSKTKVRKIKAETFYLNRDIYQLLKDYSKTIQKILGELKQKEPDSQEALIIRQRFEKTYQIIQQEFRKITRETQQEFVIKPQQLDDVNSPQKEIINSLKRIQKEMDNLNKFTRIKFKKPDDKSHLSQIFKEHLQFLMSKFEKLRHK